MDAKEREADDLLAKLKFVADISMPWPFPDFCSLSAETCASLTKSSSTLKEEVKAIKTNCAQWKQQHIVEIRKREKEMDRMKDRLQKLMQDSGRAVKSSFEMTGTLRGADRKAVESLNLYQSVIKDAEIREKQLLAENDALRRAIADSIVECAGDGAALAEVRSNRFIII